MAKINTFKSASDILTNIVQSRASLSDGPF